MGNDANPKKLTESGTTTIGQARVYAICINKTLTGTLTVNETGTAVAQFAIGTTPGTYHLTPNGAIYSVLTYVLSAADDVTIFTRSF